MARLTALLLNAAAAAVLLASPPTFAQAPETPPRAGAEIEEGNDPNWPAGVQTWQSGDRDPEGGDPQEAERRGLTSEEVEKTVDEQPTQQGTRAPEITEGEEIGLYQRLARVRAAPPGLDGTPKPRPNDLGSEPTTEMTPAQPEDMSLFPDNYIE